MKTRQLLLSFTVNGTFMVSSEAAGHGYTEMQILVINASRRDSRCKIWGIRKKMKISAKTVN